MSKSVAELVKELRQFHHHESADMMQLLHEEAVALLAEKLAHEEEFFAELEEQLSLAEHMALHSEGVF